MVQTFTFMNCICIGLSLFYFHWFEQEHLLPKMAIYGQAVPYKGSEQIIAKNGNI